jgi:peptide/nickel transport system permease protein
MLKNHPALRHVITRFGWYIVTFFVAVTINFFLPRLGPSNPVDILMSKVSVSGAMDTASAKVREEAYLKEFGLVETDAQGNILRDEQGKPVRTSALKQFGNYLVLTLQGEMGSSIIQYPKKVSELISTSIPWTLALQIPTIIIGWIVGNLLGALAAYRRGIFDRFFYPVSLLISAIPPFCFAILLVFVFGIILRWFPAMGGYDDGIIPSMSWRFFSSAAYYYFLPFMSIFLIITGGQAIGMRSMCIYELGTDYVKYSKHLGIRENKILLYMFRNAMLPQLTGLALSLGSMVGGALVTEMIFSYPGLGMTLLTAITSSDYPVIQGCTLLITVSVLIANFSVDILVGFLDPRIRTQAAGGK